MRNKVTFLLALGVAVAGLAPARANPASTRFTHLANSPAGRAALTLSIAMTPGDEAWEVTGQDVVPFYYEQGMAHADEGLLVFSSRDSLTATTVGCPVSFGPLDRCYDVISERIGPIPSELRPMGFNHIGGIDVGASGAGGPGAGLVFAPLETDPPRSRRALAAYGLDGFPLAGLLLEEIAHGFHSWVAVDPTGRFVIASEDGMDPIRVYEIVAGTEEGTVAFERRADLDLTGASATLALPNFQGCKFAGALTLYCAAWARKNSVLDVGTQIYRVDLSEPVGTQGATALGALAFMLKAEPRLVVTANTPYGLETEDVAFWGGEMHVQLRGEALGWVHIVHLRPKTSG